MSDLTQNMQDADGMVVARPRDFSDIEFRPGPQPAPAVRVNHGVAGTKLKVTIVAESWDTPGQMEELFCGTFEVCGMKISGPPDTASIEAVSTTLQQPIRREAHTQGWENTTLRAIASEIASRAGLTLRWDYDGDPPILSRIDQRNEADLAFLTRKAKDHGASVKIVSDQLIVFSEQQREAQPSTITFRRGDSRLISYSFTQDSTDAASSSTVSFKDPKTGQLAQARFTPPSSPATNQGINLHIKPIAMQQHTDT
jgi:hypothetical protein